jgi:hypothetical protein
MSSTVLREFCEADAQEINRLAVTAFEEFGCKYSDWPALAAFYGKMSDLATSGEIVVAEIAANIVVQSLTYHRTEGRQPILTRLGPSFGSWSLTPKVEGLVLVGR